LVFFCFGDGFEQFNAARMSAAGDGSTEPNLYFCPLGRNANESVLPHQTLLFFDRRLAILLLPVLFSTIR